MPHAKMRPARLACGLAMIALLSACSSDATEVRNGPQAVHPSPSELAKTPLHSCGGADQPACPE